MKYYIEITLLSGSEVNLFNLWSKVFQQIHLGFVEMKDEKNQVPIGLSFPEYVIGEKYSVLGSKLRLFAREKKLLIDFNVEKWLSRLCDYVHCTSIRPVPEKNIKSYVIYKREQPKVNKERLARRYAKRHNLTYEQALERYKAISKVVDLPFIRVKSLSSEETFCLWIKKTEVDEPLIEAFNTYGLSSKASVPEFIT